MEPIDSELLVGITQFVENHKSISFTYKFRYTDFVVHEIGLDKKLVPYDKENIEEWQEKFKKFDEANRKHQEDISRLGVLNVERLKEHVNEEELTQINEFYEKVNE